MPRSLERREFERDTRRAERDELGRSFGGEYAGHEAVLQKHGFKRSDGSTFKKRHPDGNHDLYVTLTKSDLGVSWKAERGVKGVGMTPYEHGRHQSGLDNQLKLWKRRGVKNESESTNDCAGCGAPAPKGDEWCAKCVRDSSHCKACTSGRDCEKHGNAKRESRADAMIKAKLHEVAPLYHGLTGKSFPVAKKTDADLRAHTDDRDVNMSWDHPNVDSARTKAQQLANLHGREVGITKQANGAHRVHHLSGMESSTFVASSDERISPNVHADGTHIPAQHVVKFGDLKQGERFRFFNSTPVNVKQGKESYTDGGPNGSNGKLLFHAPHRTVQRLPGDHPAAQHPTQLTRMMAAK